MTLLCDVKNCLLLKDMLCSGGEAKFHRAWNQVLRVQGIMEIVKIISVSLFKSFLSISDLLKWNWLNKLNETNKNVKQTMCKLVQKKYSVQFTSILIYFILFTSILFYSNSFYSILLTVHFRLFSPRFYSILFHFILFYSFPTFFPDHIMCNCNNWHLKKLNKLIPAMGKLVEWKYSIQFYSILLLIRQRRYRYFHIKEPPFLYRWPF